MGPLNGCPIFATRATALPHANGKLLVTLGARFCSAPYLGALGSSKPTEVLKEPHNIDANSEIAEYSSDWTDNSLLIIKSIFSPDGW